MSNLLKSSLLSLISLSFIGCSDSSVLNLSSPYLAEISSINFDSSLLANYPLGQWENLMLKTGKVSGNHEGYSSESEAVHQIINFQKAILKDSEDYAIIRVASRYYIYEIDASSGSRLDRKDLSSYKDLRSAKLIKRISYQGINPELICLSSEDGHFRFFSGESFNTSFSPAISAEGVLNRLLQMENELGSKQDHRGLFASMYRVITQRAIIEMDKYRKDGNFKAADFEEKLLINFANKYFENFDNYSQNRMDNLKEVWQMAFDSGRKSQDLGLNKSGNIAEILALSMNAHIIHDLPFTLKEVGYDNNDPVLKETFDRFNVTLFEEKDNILRAIYQHYGNNIVQRANNFFGSTGEWTMQKIFSIMRSIASNSAVSNNQKEIENRAVSYADGIIKLIPGGNSIKDRQARL